MALQALISFWGSYASCRREPLMSLGISVNPEKLSEELSIGLGSQHGRTSMCPFRNPPACDKLVGDLDGACSRRINIQRRLVYEVFKKERTVRVMRMWSHYE